MWTHLVRWDESSYQLELPISETGLGQRLLQWATSRKVNIHRVYEPHCLITYLCSGLIGHYKQEQGLTLAAFTLALGPRSFSHIWPLLPWGKSSAPMLNATLNIRSTVLCREVRDPRSIPAHANSSSNSASPPPPSLLSSSILSS